MGKGKDIALSASKHIAFIAVAAATLVIGKLALSFVPNIEVVTTLVIVYAYVFGWDCIGATTIFCILDVVLYPPSPDVIIAYFIYWNALAAVVALIKTLGARSEYIYLLTGVVMTLLFGLITTLCSHIVIGLPFLPTYVAGIPFYVLQVISTLVFTGIGFRPLTKVLQRIRSGFYKTNS